jgi:cysteine desulfurase
MKMSLSRKVRELVSVHGYPSREVYFDLENSGYLPEEVVEAMLPYFNKIGYGHPSITHKKPGWEALELVYETKEHVAETINAENPESIVFTHSGTEANNLAILGYLTKNRGRKGKVLVSAVEHLSVILPAQAASELFGFKVQLVLVDEHGFVDPELLKHYVDKDIVFVNIRMVIHEIGTTQRIKELVNIIKSVNPNTVFHTDTADAYGWLQIDLKKLEVDMLTTSSHKIHGPRGVWVLYVKEGVDVEPPLKGQLSVEKYWPGVESVPLIAGFKKVVEIIFRGFDSRVSHVKSLRDKLLNCILSSVPDVLVNGPLGDSRVANNVNVSILYIEGEALTVELSTRGVYVSSGSACSSRVFESSHVLLAIGRKHEEAHGSILFNLSQYHRQEDIDYAPEVIPGAVERLRSISAWKRGSG